jgi:hypothetical protein
LRSIFALADFWAESENHGVHEDRCSHPKCGLDRASKRSKLGGKSAEFFLVLKDGAFPSAKAPFLMSELEKWKLSDWYPRCLAA